jgi:periplasmic copper chaperone A
MSKYLIMTVFVIAALSAPAFAQSSSTSLSSAPSVTIFFPWSRATPGGAKVAAGYMMIENKGSSADRLMGGSTEATGRVEIHEMAHQNGVMTMRELLKGLDIAPNTKIELKPGSYHLMLMDLKRPLKEGEILKGTLIFEKAGIIPVEYQIKGISAGAGHGKH